MTVVLEQMCKVEKDLTDHEAALRVRAQSDSGAFSPRQESGELAAGRTPSLSEDTGAATIGKLAQIHSEAQALAVKTISTCLTCHTTHALPVCTCRRLFRSPLEALRPAASMRCSRIVR